MRELTSSEDLRKVLGGARVVAVLGAHHDPAKAAHYVPGYLHAMGYRILPVNPVLAGRTLWGEVVRGSLAELDEAVDLLDVFRRPQALAGHLPEILAMAPPPKVVWFQSGIRNDAVARSLIDAGIQVVQDRCTMAEHRRFGLGHP